MNERSELQAAWAQHLSGQQLSNAERACLRAALRDPATGHELVADQRLHQTLAALRQIDETKDAFVRNVSAACSGQDRSGVAAEEAFLPLTTTPTQRPLQLSAKRTSVRRPQASWLSPLVILLAGSTLAMAVGFVITLRRFDSVQRRVVAAEQQLKTQQADFEARIADERNRIINHPATPPMPPAAVVAEHSPDPPAAQQLAELTTSTDAVWKKAPLTASLSKGRWDLQSGTAELTMPGGSQIELTGPAAIQLVGPQHVVLDRGLLAATVPPEEIGFRISTPNARIVDLGTRFRVSVDELGETDVDLLEGEVVVVPWNAGAAGKRWHLVAGQNNRATVCPSVLADDGMLASHVSGPSGFRGQIRLAGESMDLTSRDNFERLRDGVMARLVASPDDALHNWVQLTGALNSATGSITVNGKEVPIAGLDSVLDFEDILRNANKISTSGDQQQNSVFAGKVNINGQERSFDNQEEYEAFRKEMFQPLQGFGIPGPAEMQLELDKKTNPFQP